MARSAPPRCSTETLVSRATRGRTAASSSARASPRGSIRTTTPTWRDSFGKSMVVTPDAPSHETIRSSEDCTMHCEHADRCGGCPLIALSYPRQLEAKRLRVIRALARYWALVGLAVEPA